MIKLIEPSKKYEKQVMDYRNAFLENNERFDGCAGLEDVQNYDEWLKFEERLKKKYGENYVPSTVYLGVREEDDKLVGIIDYRRELSDLLFSYGGNIGYSVLPIERRKGYAKEMLRQLLAKCKDFGATRVLLACDKENIASIKTIIANGGVLENEVIDDVGISRSGIIQRYWVSLKKRTADEVKEFTDKYLDEIL